jgi:hypothetical protein
MTLLVNVSRRTNYVSNLFEQKLLGIEVAILNGGWFRAKHVHDAPLNIGNIERVFSFHGWSGV